MLELAKRGTPLYGKNFSGHLKPKQNFNLKRKINPIESGKFHIWVWTPLEVDKYKVYFGPFFELFLKKVYFHNYPKMIHLP